MNLQAAFKEWAVICRALAQGKQAIILRKGGIAETSGEFTVEHKRFWLYPTYVHQQQNGIRAEARPLLDEVEAARPAAGTVCLSHWAEVTGIYRIHDLTRALLLAHLHFWSDETVAAVSRYREPGIYAPGSARSSMRWQCTRLRRRRLMRGAKAGWNWRSRWTSLDRRLC